MLGLRDHRTGGYDFNMKVADALDARGHVVDRVHHNAIPKRLQGKRAAGSWEVLRRVVKFNPDVIIVSRSYAFMIPLRLLLCIWKVPVLYLVHHLEWMDRAGRAGGWRRSVVKWLIRRGDLIWCNSHATRKGLSEMGIKPEKLRVIPPGFEPFEVTRTAREPGHRPMLLCVGALTERKGQETILKACSLLGRKDFRLVLAGSAEEEPEYAARVVGMASSESLSGVVSIRGYLGRTELCKLLEEADILVHAAPWEAFGMAIAEAMRAGLPVIASMGGAVTELVNSGVEGLLYEPGDAVSLSGHMASLLDDEQMRLRLGSAARKRAESFYTWEKTCEEFAGLVEETACGKVRRNMPCGPGVTAADR